MSAIKNHFLLSYLEPLPGREGRGRALPELGILGAPLDGRLRLVHEAGHAVRFDGRLLDVHRRVHASGTRQ